MSSLPTTKANTQTTDKTENLTSKGEKNYKNHQIRFQQPNNSSKMDLEKLRNSKAFRELGDMLYID